MERWVPCYDEIVPWNLNLDLATSLFFSYWQTRGNYFHVSKLNWRQFFACHNIQVYSTTISRIYTIFLQVELDNPTDTEPANSATTDKSILAEAGTSASTSQVTTRSSPSTKQQETPTRASPSDNNLKRKVLLIYFNVFRKTMIPSYCTVCMSLWNAFGGV